MKKKMFYTMGIKLEDNRPSQCATEAKDKREAKRKFEKMAKQFEIGFTFSHIHNKPYY